MFESRRHGGFSHHGVVSLFGFSRRDVADRLQQPAIVEPVHPSERCELDSVARQSGWEHSDNQDGDFGGRGERIFVAAR